MVGRKKSIAKRILVAVAIVLVLAVGAGAWYVGDYYHADSDALTAVAVEGGTADGVEVRELEGGAIAFVPAKAEAGLVFYPGAKVEPIAYAPLMRRCAERGFVCVIVKPLFNLAIIDMDAADGVIGQFPDVDTWAIAGHSMGGVAAADYLSRHESDFAGIVFLASYPAVDLSGFNGSALSVYGSNDQVLDREAYEDARANLPAQARELVIEGGNHANFGNYGGQAGDGEASISREEQQAETCDAIAASLA